MADLQSICTKSNKLPGVLLRCCSCRWSSGGASDRGPGVADNIAGTDVEMVQDTNYPWSGNVAITVNPKVRKTFVIKIRVPTRDVPTRIGRGTNLALGADTERQRHADRLVRARVRIAA